MKERKLPKPYTDIEYLDFPLPKKERYDQTIDREVQELQVGGASSADVNPKIFRANQDGIWLGRHKFSDPNPAFRVNMLGQVVAYSYETAITGQRVKIVNNSIEIYDSSNVRRMLLQAGTYTSYDSGGQKRVQIEDGSIIIYDDNEVFQGQIFGDSVGGNMYVEGVDNLALACNNHLHILLMNDDTTYMNVPFVLVSRLSDPVGYPGMMYYNSTADEIRGYTIAGGWSAL